MKLMKEKAEQLLQRCEVVVITSVNEEGYPRPVPMSKIKSEGYSVVWMATGNDSRKRKISVRIPKQAYAIAKMAIAWH